MRIVLIAVFLVASAGMACAQAQPDNKPPYLSEYNTGRTVTPEIAGQKQPQGLTGPTNTTTGGAPAESPQGEAPPGMQSAPEGSSKSVVAPDKK